LADKKVKICYGKIEIEPSKNIPATNLRGFLGYLFVNEPEFHHHTTSPFHYPLIQYKKLDGKLLVMGLNDYAKIVFNKISKLESIVATNEKIRILNVDLTTNTHEVSEKNIQYRFITPWLALNKKNYSTYKTLEKNQRRQFLENILVGNFLSALKGLSVFIDFKIHVEIKKFRSIKTVAHENEFQAFYVEVTTNISLPRYIGVGKSVSKGFGTLEVLK